MSAKKQMDKALAERVAALLETLEDQGAIERCNHGGCRRLAIGEPDFGPNVEAPVCEKHVPRGIVNLIDVQRDTTDALRAVQRALAPYGYHYDHDTGKPKPA